MAVPARDVQRGRAVPRGPVHLRCQPISAVRAPLLLSFAALDCWCRPLDVHSKIRPKRERRPLGRRARRTRRTRPPARGARRARASRTRARHGGGNRWPTRLLPSSSRRCPRAARRPAVFGDAAAPSMLRRALRAQLCQRLRTSSPAAEGGGVGISPPARTRGKACGTNPAGRSQRTHRGSGRPRSSRSATPLPQPCPRSSRSRDRGLRTSLGHSGSKL